MLSEKMSGDSTTGGSDSPPQNNVQLVDMNQLTLADLCNLQEQLENELEFFVNSLQQLKEVQGKFTNSGKCLTKLTPENKGKEILVPLTSSMYVPGSISDVERVLIEIGTGYYAEMAVPKAKEYFQRKSQDLNAQIERLQSLVSEKQKAKAVVSELVRTKIQQARPNVQQRAPAFS